MEAHAFRLFDVAPSSWEAPDPSRFDALLAGSGNVFRHGGPALRAFARLPVYAVGETTAEAAREAGFTVVQTGSSGLQALIGQLDGDQRGRHRPGAGFIDHALFHHRAARQGQRPRSTICQAVRRFWPSGDCWRRWAAIGTARLPC